MEILALMSLISVLTDGGCRGPKTNPPVPLNLDLRTGRPLSSRHVVGEINCVVQAVDIEVDEEATFTDAGQCLRTQR